jgi:hypothetical protein
LRNRVATLERRIAMLTAVFRLVLPLLRVSGFKLELSRVADAARKRRLLGAIERARRFMPLSISAIRASGPRGRLHGRIEDALIVFDEPAPSCRMSRPVVFSWLHILIPQGGMASFTGTERSVRRSSTRSTAKDRATR